MLRKVNPNFFNKFFQLATLKSVACKVEHAVEIRATTLFNLQCNNHVGGQVERKCFPYYLAFTLDTKVRSTQLTYALEKLILPFNVFTATTVHPPLLVTSRA